MIIDDLSIVLALIAVIIAQMVERHLFSLSQVKKENRLLDELSRSNKAVISKNANDYVMTTAMDKTPMEERPKADNDLVPEEALSDEEFMKTINKDLSE